MVNQTFLYWDLGFKHIPSVTWGRVSYLPQGGGGGGNWQDKIPRWLHVKILLVQGAGTQSRQSYRTMFMYM